MGPLISAGQLETVSSYVDDDAAGRLPRHRPRRARLLVPADRPPPRLATTTAPPARRSSGPSPRVIPFDDEADGDPDRQRHALRALRLDLDPRRRQGAARLPRDRDRRALDQLEQLGPGLDAVRRLQAVRASAASSARTRSITTPRSRTSSTPPEEELGWTDGTTRRQGLRDHRRRRRDRRRDGTAASPRRARSWSASTASRGRRGRPVDRGGRDRRGAGQRHVPAGPRRVRPHRRALQQRRHQPHRRRLRARDLASPPSSASRTSTCSASSSAASTGSRTCSIPAAARSSTRPRSSPTWAPPPRRSATRRRRARVVAMSREIGVEFARRGVRCNALCPGPVDTELLRELFSADRVRPSAGSSTSRWAASASRPRSPTRRSSSPATSRAT